MTNRNILSGREEKNVRGLSDLMTSLSLSTDAGNGSKLLHDKDDGDPVTFEGSLAKINTILDAHRSLLAITEKLLTMIPGDAPKVNADISLETLNGHVQFASSLNKFNRELADIFFDAGIVDKKAHLQSLYKDLNIVVLSSTEAFITWFTATLRPNAAYLSPSGTGSGYDPRQDKSLYPEVIDRVRLASQLVWFCNDRNFKPFANPEARLVNELMVNPQARRRLDWGDEFLSSSSMTGPRRG